jgi:hypothetical protein
VRGNRKKICYIGEPIVVKFKIYCLMPNWNQVRYGNMLNFIIKNITNKEYKISLKKLI